MGAQWLSGRVLDSRPRGRGFEPHRRHCVVSLSKNIYPSLVLVLPRKTRPFITERVLMERNESNQTKQKQHFMNLKYKFLFNHAIYRNPDQIRMENKKVRLCKLEQFAMHCNLQCIAIGFSKFTGSSLNIKKWRSLLA